MDTMKALVKPRPKMNESWPEGLFLEERPIPSIEREDQVKLEVVAAGICGTDVGIYHSKESLKVEMANIKSDSVIVGHEFCGELAEAGDIARERIAKILFEKSKWVKDDRELQQFITKHNFKEMVKSSELIPLIKEKFYITSEMHVVCGVCHQCRTGNGHACQNTVIKGLQEDGAFAKYTIVPVSNITMIRKGDIQPEIIAYMDAFGNALHTVSSVNLMGKRVAVLGCGVQGLMAIAIAKYAGASLIIATDVSNPAKGITHEKLENTKFSIARNVGADYCFDMALESSKKELMEVVMRETDNTGVDAVFEMSGSPYAYDDALSILRMGGTLSLLGLPSGNISVDFANRVIFRGITIKGIIGRRMFETWETMERILKSGLANLMLDNGFVSHILPMEEYEKGFKAHETGDAIKVVLKP